MEALDELLETEITKEEAETIYDKYHSCEPWTDRCRALEILEGHNFKWAVRESVKLDKNTGVEMVDISYVLLCDICGTEWLPETMGNQLSCVSVDENPDPFGGFGGFFGFG